MWRFIAYFLARDSVKIQTNLTVEKHFAALYGLCVVNILYGSDAAFALFRSSQPDSITEARYVCNSVSYF